MIKKSVNYLIFSFFCLFAIPLVTHASCDYQRASELSKEASNVQFNYYYDFDGPKILFTYTINNVTEDIYVEDNYGNVFTAFDNAMPITSGAKIQFNIYSRDPNCYGEKLLTKYFKIPFYNSYALTEICDNNSSNLCDIWADVSGMSYAEFESIVSDTKNDLANDSLNDEEKDNSEIVIVVLSLMVGIIIISTIIILIKVIRKKRYL